jgi:hypothetical protein
MSGGSRTFMKIFRLVEKIYVLFEEDDQTIYISLIREQDSSNQGHT